MLRIVRPLLLLLLLAVDYAGDPNQGLSPLSRPLASTENYCFSMQYRGEVLQNVSASARPTFFLVPTYTNSFAQADCRPSTVVRSLSFSLKTSFTCTCHSTGEKPVRRCAGLEPGRACRPTAPSDRAILTRNNPSREMNSAKVAARRFSTGAFRT